MTDELLVAIIAASTRIEKQSKNINGHASPVVTGGIRSAPVVMTDQGSPEICIVVPVCRCDGRASYAVLRSPTSWFAANHASVLIYFGAAQKWWAALESAANTVEDYVPIRRFVLLDV